MNMEVKDLIIAEDDQDDVDILHLGLKELNLPFNLRHAHDVKSLLEMLGDKIPYLLFLDINFPPGDSISSIAAIRAVPDYDNLPIVLYSSHTWPTTISDAFTKGADVFVKKARNFTELVEKLKVIFSIDWSDKSQWMGLRQEQRRI